TLPEPRAPLIVPPTRWAGPEPDPDAPLDLSDLDLSDLDLGDLAGPTTGPPVHATVSTPRSARVGGDDDDPCPF
ncbi:MAG: hypothetical protein M3N21_03550, partial [Actinomycetota bacterium]|nr:hypothetical protein [Actinomycetota bacterium]